MIEFVLEHADLARVRFAHSPVREPAASLRVLQDHRRRPMHEGWLASVRPRLAGLRLDLLLALAPPGRHLPSFLYQRTPAGTALLEAARSREETG